MGDLIPTDTNLPAHLQAAQPAMENNALITTGGPTFPMISLRGRQFRLKKDGEEKTLSGLTELKIVILAATPNSHLNAKTYYEGEYTTGSDEAPDCSSADGVAPDGNATSPQSTACATCPKNAWGSAISKMTGKESKACKDTKMIYFVAPDKVDGEIVALRVPTMSLRHLSKFARALSSRKIPVSAVVTTIKFVDSEYPEVEFGFGGYLDEAVYRTATDRIASDEVVDILQGNTYAVETSEADVPEPPAHVERTQEAIPNLKQHGTTPESTGDMFSTGEPAAEEAVVAEPVSEIDALKAQLAALQGANQAGQAATPPDVDNTGRAWDARIDSGNRKLSAKGVWMRRKNVPNDVYNQVIAELTGAASSPEPTTTPKAPPKSVFDDPASTPEEAEGADTTSGDDLDSLLSDWG